MELFISGFILSLSLCLDIGIVNIAIIKTGIEKGFFSSFYIGLGSTVGDMVYVILSFIGLSIIFEIILVKWILWIAGSAVLLYLCYTMVVKVIKPEKEDKEDKIDLQNVYSNKKKYFITGLSLALSSPTAILWFAAIGGSVISAQADKTRSQLIYFFIGFIIASIIWGIFLAYISYKGGKIMKDKIKKIFSFISAVIFLVIAIYVFMDGYKNLIK